MEPRYEDSALLRYVAHSHDCARSRRNNCKAADRQLEAVRSDEAESAGWLQARRNGQGNEALGGRMYGDAGAKNRYAIRRVRSVGPRRGGRDHAEGSAVTLQFMCNLYSITTNQEAIRALFRVVNRYVGNLAPMPGVFPDYPAPVIRNAGAERELVMMRWGNISLLEARKSGQPGLTIRLNKKLAYTTIFEREHPLSFRHG